MKKFIYKYRGLLLIALFVIAITLENLFEIEQWILIAATLVLIIIGKVVIINVEPQVLAQQAKEKEKAEQLTAQMNLIPHEHKLDKTSDRKTYWNEPENCVIAKLRDTEEINQAPFSNKTLIEWDLSTDSKYICPVIYRDYANVKGVSKYGDAPVLKILGACTTNNMATGCKEVFEPNTTYRGTLFNYLHGGNLDVSSLDYFEDENRGTAGMPVKRIGNDRKTRSEREWEFVQYGDYFFSSHGHQRTVFAMYHLYQKYGTDAVIKNVKITKYSL
jgi:hypothetical protein